MDLTLKRTLFSADGIFGELYDPDGTFLQVTLEHSYSNDSVDWNPKIPAGTYECVRGMHRLSGMQEDFETFQVMKVPGHDGILIHCGNSNADSSGCILLGTEKVGSKIINSRLAFMSFLQRQTGVDSFQLIVV